MIVSGVENIADHATNVPRNIFKYPEINILENKGEKKKREEKKRRKEKKKGGGLGRKC